MELVAFVGADKETWGQITGLVNRGTWEKIILIKSKEGSEYPTPKNGDAISVDTSIPLKDLKEDIMKKLKGKLKEFDAHLSIASGNGKEHMALISALLSIPVGIRLVVFTKEGVQTLT